MAGQRKKRIHMHGGCRVTVVWVVEVRNACSMDIVGAVGIKALVFD
jgi:hypothetical protein